VSNQLTDGERGGGVDSESDDVSRAIHLFLHIQYISCDAKSSRCFSVYYTSTGLLQAAQRWQFFLKGDLFVVYSTQLLLTPSDSAVSEDALIESHPRAARSHPRLG
jgi:hypothetical protein